jgi:hypothetical protein
VSRIRLATHDESDVAAAVRMGCTFAAESPYRGFITPNPDAQRSLVHYLVDHGALFLASVGGADVGLLALSVAPLLFTGELVVSDVAWWVDPEWRFPRSSVGGRLLVTGEGWAMEVARAKGVPHIWLQMMNPAGGDPKVAEIYKRRGYLPLETIYTKRLPAAA